MKVTVTKEDGLKRKLKITVPAKDLDSKVEAKLEQLSKTMKVPGFRPGKVPTAVIKQRYGDSILGDVLQEAVNDTTTKALNDEKLRPAMQPNINIDKFEKGQDLEYTVELEVLPEFETVDLKTLSLTKHVTKADSKAVEDALKRITDNNKTPKKIEGDRKTKSGDVVLIDFDGRVDGESRPGMKAAGHNLEIGSNSFIPGFEDQLVGKKAGDDVLVKVTFPTTYHAKELAGKEAEFDVKIHEIQEMVTPEATDELAQSFGLKDLKDLKEKIQEQIESEYKSFSRTRLKRDLLDTLEDKHTFQVPENLVKAEFDAIWRQVQAELEMAKKRGDKDAENAKEDDLKAEYQQIAERRVRLGLVLSEIGRANKVTVEQADLNNALINEARKYPGQEKQVFDYYQKNQQALEMLRAPLFEDKVVDFIFDQVKLSEKEVSFEDLTKDPDEDKTLTSPNGGKEASAKKSSAKKSSAK